ncbi:hypothetical protein B0T20DRAFT_455688 [Sordaria brevicollis]|uniref:Wax synthase domain-containing protein n=1 Tax=Sordaria brevicollis TaxID=83679 RepID=A0AAE0P9L5_SORBR|nr:hypothetical protein B0T20DRAFT_455688 [Sordaria brevicollis]
MSPLTGDAASSINLPAHYLSLYRSLFYSALLPSDGSPQRVQPFLLPFCLLGTFLLPIAYLCIPQYTISTIQGQQVRIRREWVYRLRWLVGAVMVWWNLGVVVGLPGFQLHFGGLGSPTTTEGEGYEYGGGGEGGYKGWMKAGKTTASACTAMAYAAGLMCGWGTIWGLEAVVFGGYQGWGMRVRRRLRRRGSDGKDGEEKSRKDGKRVKGELRVGFVDGDVDGTMNSNSNTNGSANRRRRQSKSESIGVKRGSWGPDTTDLRRRNLNPSDMFDSKGWELVDAGYGKVALPTSTSTFTETNDTSKAINTNQSHRSAERKQEDKGQRWTIDETVDLDKYEYYWEPYPDQGTLGQRLDWVMDMFNSFRGAGWNYSISSIPSLQKPVIPTLLPSILSSSSSTPNSKGQILPYLPSGPPVSFTPLPLSTPSQFHRSTTIRQFLLSRLFHITWSYLALDFFTISARLDPYFVLGPNGPLRHPTYLSDLASSSPSAVPPLSLLCAKLLASLPPWGLNFARSLLSLSGVLGGLFLYSYVWQLTQFFILGKLLGNETQGMAELWRYPCFFGGFTTNVLDRGLAGFWGGWWHQTFRVGFTGPVRWLVKMGVFGQPSNEGEGKGEGEGEGEGEGDKAEEKRTKKKRKVIAMTEMATAFLLSGILHALGGWTSTAFRITTTTSPSSPSSSYSSSHSSPSTSTDALTLETRNRLAVFAEPVGFFVSQFLGCLVQAFLIVVLRNFVNLTTTKITGSARDDASKQKVWKNIPRWIKRMGNGVFVLMWLHWTRWMLIDDMSRSGLFLFEPVPVSVFRLLGLGGMPGEGRGDWWRLDGEYVPSLWRGGRWWERGVRI